MALNCVALFILLNNVKLVAKFELIEYLCSENIKQIKLWQH